MIRIGLGQINPTVGDFDGNSQKIAGFIAEAKTRKCDLVLFPELALCGYPPEDLLLKRAFVGANRQYLRKLSTVCKGINVICGYAGSRSNKAFNSAAVIGGGKVLLSYNKIALPNYGVFDEKRYFVPGNEVPLLHLGKILIGINICEDIWVCPGVTEQQAALGAQLILNISSSPYHKHKAEERIEMLQDRARSNRCYVGYINSVGGQDELVFDGASLVIDPTGKVIARAAQFAEELLVVDIPEIKEHRRGRQKPRGGDDNTPAQGFAVKQVELKAPFVGRPRRARKAQCAKRLVDAEEVYQAVTLGVRDYIRKNGFRQAIIGLSGGVDSALTAAIAVDAIGKENVFTLFLPSRYSSELSRVAAKRQAQLLGIRMDTVSIDDLFEEYEETLAPLFRDSKSGLTEENLQARIRGNILMAFSNKLGYLVLSTSNKSEAAVGYTTLYGDMVGGFSVLKDIPKTLVYKICEHLNRSRGREIIAQEIIDRPPTAELKDNQLDSDSLPPYEVLDEILRLYVELDWNDHEIIAAGFDRKTVERVIRMVGAAEYKRRQSAPGIKITPRAFGKDRRWPITNKF
ncbi:MAG: NAD+ synthase [candidate division Zixibacteria bacterium]|nr:NAD+ synthase [candidate division Zixibacteria bacterium]